MDEDEGVQPDDQTEDSGRPRFGSAHSQHIQQVDPAPMAGRKAYEGFEEKPQKKETQAQKEEIDVGGFEADANPR
jgi:hypothetical protein